MQDNIDEFRELNVEELIAPFPKKARDTSRLLVINRKNQEIKHELFRNIINYFSPGDCLVINNTKVIKSRLTIKDENENLRDILVLKRINENKTIVVLGKKLKTNRKYIFNEGIQTISVKKNDDGSMVFELNKALDDEYLSKYGTVPLPHYIINKRTQQNNKSVIPEDEERYQTVYASEKGSIAAPTAGFHFTKELLNKISQMGVSIVSITLHIGWGTFKMVRENIDDFIMPEELCIIGEKEAQIINKTKSSGKRVFVVGTSSMRALEKMQKNGLVISGRENADIFIKPGYKFNIADAFITNFHLPDSPPLYMTVAFCTKELLLKAYKQAVAKRYRFYSYGDACLII